ncbi:MAG: Trm112 family protein [Gammaproteobacteria bacterium]
MDQKLLEILVCPVSQDSLILVEEELISKKSMLAYPIRDGIPVMLENEARKITEEEIKNI